MDNQQLSEIITVFWKRAAGEYDPEERDHDMNKSIRRKRKLKGPHTGLVLAE